MAIIKTDMQEKSQDAMRKLLGDAQNLRETGEGELNNKDVVEATQYYEAWKNKRLVPTFLLALVPFLLFYHPPSGFLFIFIAFAIKEMEDSSKAKLRYVEEMVGNWAGVNDAEYYKKGLVLELWKNLVRKDNYTFKFNLKAYLLGISVVAILGVVFFFSPDFIIFGRITFKKIILVLAFLASEFLILKNFIDEPRAF